VAVTEGGEIAGHIALKRGTPGAPLAELGVAFVKPEFRGGGVFQNLFRAILALAKNSGLDGLFARAVTSHVISQKTCRQFGFRECGLLLALFPGDVDFRQLTGRVVQKESALLLFLPLQPLEAHVIYPPAAHRDRILATYAALGLPVRPAETDDPAEPLPGRETELAASAVAVMNVADIHVTCYGADVVHAVRTSLRQQCLHRRDVVYLHLDLESPATARLVPEFEAMGFFYAGVLPRSLQGRDALILQYLNNIAIAYDLLKPYSPEANELLDYIRRHDPGVSV
jgi:serine/threonine-protein kinase RsbW